VIDAENMAGVAFPLAYRGIVFPLAYVAMLLGDASDIEIIDLRATGIGGHGGGGGGIADHGLLAGLGDDDHAQYLLTAGTRALTGDQDMGGFALTDYTPQVANTVFAGPTAAPDAAPTFRALTAEDMAVGALLPFAAASDSTTQNIANVAAVQVVTFNTSELLSSAGITRTSASRYTINQAGTYMLTLTGIANLGATPGAKILSAWLRVDGVDVAGTRRQVSLSNVAIEKVVTIHALYKFTAGQYFEFWTWGDDTDCRWLATAAGITPTRPAVPSVTMTAHLISGAGLA